MLEDNLRVIFSENLKRLMTNGNKTQSDLIMDLKLKQTTLSDWINAKKFPRIDKIEVLANYFGVKKSDLIEKYIPSPHPTTELSKRVKKEISEELERFEESLMNADGLMLDGELASEETVQNLLSAMKIGMEIARKKNKEKFTPKKYK